MPNMLRVWNFTLWHRMACQVK